MSIVYWGVVDINETPLLATRNTYDDDVDEKMNKEKRNQVFPRILMKKKKLNDSLQENLDETVQRRNIWNKNNKENRPLPPLFSLTGCQMLVWTFT